MQQKRGFSFECKARGSLKNEVPLKRNEDFQATGQRRSRVKRSFLKGR
jgi:hypothetical protein